VFVATLGQIDAIRIPSSVFGAARFAPYCPGNAEAVLDIRVAASRFSRRDAAVVSNSAANGEIAAVAIEAIRLAVFVVIHGVLAVGFKTARGIPAVRIIAVDPSIAVIVLVVAADSLDAIRAACAIWIRAVEQFIPVIIQIIAAIDLNTGRNIEAV